MGACQAAAAKAKGNAALGAKDFKAAIEGGFGGSHPGSSTIGGCVGGSAPFVPRSGVSGGGGGAAYTEAIGHDDTDHVFYRSSPSRLLPDVAYTTSRDL